MYTRNKTKRQNVCAVAVKIEYRQAAASMQWALVEGSGFLFPSVLESGGRENLALTPAQMTSNLQAHVRAAIYGSQAVHVELLRCRGGGGSPHGWDGYGRPHGIRWTAVRGRGQQIRRGIGVCVERNEAFARHGLHPGRRCTTVVEIRKIVRGVPAGETYGSGILQRTREQ